ncbi:MAG: MaoC family dehydratase [Acidobacteriota bacterium]|nr:MAG: MaoC family dehydratase [Acidobacteriota bacterium]
MTELVTGGSLPHFEIVSKNYGEDHANRIHSDEGAARYGFAGALVPGVAIYGYLARPVVEALGREWLARGSMSAKFLKPVYDAQRVTVEGRVESSDPPEIALELRNPAGELCAVGRAGLPRELPRLDPAEYPERPLPDVLRPASIDAVRPGEVFGSLDFILDPAQIQNEFLDDMLDDSPVYRGEGAVCHPAWWIARANEMIMLNVALGPWIHTASELRQYDLARDGEALSMRGRVVEAFEKRGHEIVRLDLAVFGDWGRPITRILHSAIIKIG